ncbi:hypothetical protein ASPWEDRAFT_104515 [Aspergillus wentii DTO 134E9]|uniref:Sin3 binding protein n=1 Tax=Aspergillus wentii DTO 134E9 TaxID=1073089 RepID=A0A1L9RX12_ASPWE|nr:uncharacterized protein ASPWEDRAFT_104515 [Aspergillus wentii DTO 134E9]KAI9931846.1 DNA-binding proteins Bright/BRCAA1/RBP1 and proteins containing BRIGHT domain [Aspergillus wentii]OJJ39469.1 hypothetical protein ASPWEDRAFT_104515 [Aspergillus wentii DTO 134E9]
MAFQSSSSIAMALAGKTASVDIPQSRSGFTSGSRDPSRLGQPALLPTPPNSISPNLAPHAFKHRAADMPGSPRSGSHLDSDIDLGDAVEHADARGESQSAHDLDSVGAITPGMLAKYHLPEIMLHQGPLAIRHVMGFLTTSVPGFSRIPPAKARRLVVAALEGRGSEAEGGGPKGDVVFEKVGWGRWDARRRGEPSRDSRHLNVSPPSSLSNSFQSRGMQIPRNSTRDNLSPYGTSMAGDSAVFSYTETHYGGPDMLEDEADKMSLDGDYCSSSEAPEDEVRDEDWGEEDVTDEEDWAQIGADALRARSMNGASGFVPNHLKQPPQLRGGGPASSTLAKSAPQNTPIQQIGFSVPAGMVGDQEERAAVEALLRLGSM